MAEDTTNTRFDKLCEIFQGNRTVSAWLERVRNESSFINMATFFTFGLATFNAILGPELGRLVFCAANPPQDTSPMWAILVEASYMSTLSLRKVLQTLHATSWLDLLIQANNSVQHSSDFDSLWSSFSQFKLQEPNPNKENEMYVDTARIFEPIAKALGAGYHPTNGARAPDRLYPDAWIVPLQIAQDQHIDPNYDKLVENTILDVEIKKPWKPVTSSTAWGSLPSNGNAGGSPSTGLKEVIQRAHRFFASESTQQQSYFAVISDNIQFVFVSLDRTGNLKVSPHFPWGREPVAIIYYLCSLQIRAGEFRNAASSLPPPPTSSISSIPKELLSLEAANQPPVVTLTTESEACWMLELKSLLGKGGHGVVFSCEQASLAPKNELDVLCLKIAPNTDPHAVELLELEDFHLNLMRACPYVPKVIAKGQLFLAGTPCLGLLTDVVGVPLPTLSKSQLQSILPHLWNEMCYVLGQIHSHGLVHCDVKPAHFVVNRSGLWLIDFGSSYHPLSRVLRQDTLYMTRLFSSPRCLNEDGSWPMAQDDIQSAAYSLISLLSPNGELPEGHQSSHPTQLISLVPPQHRRMIRSVLYEARLV